MRVDHARYHVTLVLAISLSMWACRPGASPEPSGSLGATGAQEMVTSAAKTAGWPEATGEARSAPTPYPEPTHCGGAEARAVQTFVLDMRGLVDRERAVMDDWNAWVYAPETRCLPPDEKVQKLDELARRTDAILYDAAGLAAPEECLPAREKYVIALRKRYRFCQLLKPYVPGGDEQYRTLANQEREGATRLRREVWGMLGDLEYWLEQHPCPGPDTPWPGLEGAASA